MSTADAMLSLENVDVFYGAIHALHGVSLKVRRGQIKALRGKRIHD